MAPGDVYVLDASALLAVLNQEAGAELVLPLLAGAYLSAVNWSEVVLNVAQDGLFWMLKVSVSPLASEAVGVKL